MMQQQTTLISQEEVRTMLAMQSQSGLNKLRSRDPTFPRPIKTSQARQARARFDLAEVEAWISTKKQEAARLQ